MSEIKRRDFLKTVAVGGAAFSLAAAAWPTPLGAATGQKADIGQCKNVKVTSVSEVGWWDTKVLMKDMMASGGPRKADQWTTVWDPKNGAGSCSLVEVEGLDGKVTRILLDTGWNPSYMAWRYEMTGVDKLLAEKKIDYLVISHEHLDHLWGLQATLEKDPAITMVIPSTFRPQGKQFMAGTSFNDINAVNTVKHQGKVMVMRPGGVHRMFEGAGLAVFDVPFVLKLRGEQSLFFNVKDKGLVLVTGCCHQGISTFADYAKKNVSGGEKLHGLYGGLHIAPFGPLNEKGAKMVRAMAKFGFEKMACNHCTGLPAVEMMKKLGYPIIGGSGSQGSSSKLYVGNGDAVTFG